MSKSLRPLALIAACLFSFQAFAQNVFTFNDGLQRSTPEEQGVRTEAILEFFDSLSARNYEIHNIMILRHDKVIAEHSWYPYSAQYKHAMYSSTKTFTAAAVGFAVQEGLVKVSDRVVDIFPDLLPEKHSPEVERLTVKHLLSMTAGHRNTRYDGAGDELVRNFLAMDYSSEPGTVFAYNVTCSHMLSQIITRVTGETIYDYLKPRLFDPLGLSSDIFWEMDLSGRNMGNGGMHSRISDMAKFGLFLKNHGTWNGRQILDPQWVKDMTTCWIVQSSDKPEKDDGTSGYGYQTWLGGHDSFRAIGASNQVILVVPGSDVVVAAQSALGDEYGFNALVYKLCDTMSDKKLKANRSIDLAAALKDRAYKLPFTGSDPHAAIKTEARRYQMFQNQYGIKYIDTRFDKDGNFYLTLEGDAFTTNIPFGLFDWKMGVTDRKSCFGRAIYTNMMGVTGYDTAGFCSWAAPGELDAYYLSMFNINTDERFHFSFDGEKITMTVKSSAGPQADRAHLGIPGSMNGPANIGSGDIVLEGVIAR
ncbi:MAG: beta-lactamase family protein [Bacteroidales bacterium]|nr:beta-lactamase family protein [Bacteroidales bacterium]